MEGAHFTFAARLWILCALCALWLVILVIQFIKGRQIMILVLLGAIIAPLFYFEYTYHQALSKFEKVSHQLSQNYESDVHCQRGFESDFNYESEFSKHPGFVPWNDDGKPTDMYLRYDACTDLQSYLKDPSKPTLAEVVAVHVLTHESMHLRGEEVEAVAECEAVQRDYTTATLLGATPDEADALARRYWTEAYPNLDDDNHEYISSDCRRGGKLDEKLAHAPWAKHGP
jgi:hypothetical protein